MTIKSEIKTEKKKCMKGILDVYSCKVDIVK